MEVLIPVHRPHHSPTREILSGLSASGVFQPGFGRTASSMLPEISEEAGGSSVAENGTSCGRIYVAVGKSPEKVMGLLYWTFKHFGCGQICLLYVHKPSSVIPTLLGKLPVKQASEEVLSAFRREEKEQMKKLLDSYLHICNRAKAETSIVSIESDKVHEGIVELVNKHSVRKLVMGCMKVKKSSKIVNYAAKNAPLFCEIWFINKGKHAWTREATGNSSLLPPYGLSGDGNAETVRPNLVKDSDNNLSYPEHLRPSTDMTTSCARVSSELICSEATELPAMFSSDNRFPPLTVQSSSSTSSTSPSSGDAFTERRVSSDSDLKFEEENTCLQLVELRIEAEASRNEVEFEELLKCRKLEFEATKIISKVKILESAFLHEVKLRKEVEDELKNTIHEKEKLLEEKEEVTRELQRTMRNITVTDSRAQEGNRRSEEASGEFKHIQASIASLLLEKQRLWRQKMEAMHWLDRWKSRGQTGAANCNGFLGFVEELPELAEFSLLELQTATCDFSESFKLGQGGYGCVYKGEMLGRTVAIKKLHPNDMQGRSEFQKEVQVLGKLQHPHLVTFLGSCPEAWCLVFEYLPNGSLQDLLFRKNNLSPLTWKTRVRMIAEIASAICFLHSTNPEKIVHGDLKPQNILLNSELNCKICDFGICRLVTEDTLHSPHFCHATEPKGSFPYTDPELSRNGVLTPKSDIYSFGVIILQLLTGKPPVGLVGEVRRTMLCGKLASILDPTAGEWPTLVAMQLVDWGLQFCKLNSRDRPDLRPSLVKELEQLYASEERPVPSFFLCPIHQEIMHDPQVAADGFTYEGEALRGWLENGRETSPMTNLRLNHSHLTPNHSLRLAIQDWLCKS